MARSPRLLKALHRLLWCAGIVAALCFVVLCLAAYGFPGAWLQSAFDRHIPAEVGRLTVERFSYRLGTGLILERVLLTAPDGTVRASCDRGAIDIHVLSLEPLERRVSHLAIDRLYVAEALCTGTLERLEIDDDRLEATGFTLTANDGYRLASFSHADAALRGIRLPELHRRFRSLTIDDLFIAQIRYDPDSETELELPPPEQRPAFPDLSQIRLPILHSIPLRLNNPDILEIRAKTLEGRVSSGNGLIRLDDLRGDVDGTGKQLAEATVLLDLPNALANASIRGFIYHENLNGLWRAIDLPIIEEYTSNIVLNGPAWGDCTFTVGFNKYDDIFTLTANLIAPEGGTYHGIPFDEASSTITCRSIWYTHAVIGPFTVRRNGETIAGGTLRFKLPEDRFSFNAYATGLTPEECLRVLDLPFAGQIPAITADAHPNLSIRGHFPFYLGAPAPSTIFLNGSLSIDAPGTLGGLPYASASCDLTMRNGVLSLNDLALTLPQGGTLEGALSLTFPDDDAPTTFSTALHLTRANFADLIPSLGNNALANCHASGFIDIRGDIADIEHALHGTYDLTIEGGLIQRLPLFAGLTDLLADHVPGIASFTDTSSARIAGTIRNSIFHIPDFKLDGNLLSIEGPAVYDLPNDSLHAEVTAGNFKEDTFLGTITRWATVPVNSFLWRVRVDGPLSAPKWVIVTFLDRLFSKPKD